VEIVFKDDSKKFIDIIKPIKEIISISAKQNKINLSLEKPQITNPIIIKRLIENGVEILYFNEITESLEEIYLDLIKEA
jgi:hypothetical protein